MQLEDDISQKNSNKYRKYVKKTTETQTFYVGDANTVGSDVIWNFKIRDCALLLFND